MIVASTVGLICEFAFPTLLCLCVEFQLNHSGLSQRPRASRRVR
jgi:hypothetical protein